MSLNAHIGRQHPRTRGLEVEEAEHIDAAPAPNDYPDPLDCISGGNAGAEQDAEPDALAPARGICNAIGATALLLAVALVLVALLWPRFAGAAEWHVALHGASLHFGSIAPQHAARAGMCGSAEACAAARYRAANPGLGLRWQHSPTLGLQAGIYRNSYARTSRYAGLDWTPLALAPRLRAGLFVGATDNYPYRGFAVVPLGGALLRWQADRASAALRLLPPVDGVAKGAAAIELGWRL